MVVSWKFNKKIAEEIFLLLLVTMRLLPIKKQILKVQNTWKEVTGKIKISFFEKDGRRKRGRPSQ
jgi:hypothetical protein